jgi:Cft2 family RNA processing exonuclease
MTAHRLRPAVVEAQDVRAIARCRIDGSALDAVVLSHAHLDHSGALPILAQRGYRGPIYATPATRDLCAPMLEDAASIQESDARHIERLIARGVHRARSRMMPWRPPSPGLPRAAASS